MGRRVKVVLIIVGVLLGIGLLANPSGQQSEKSTKSQSETAINPQLPAPVAKPSRTIEASIDDCVSRKAKESRDWQTQQGIEQPAVRPDVLEEFRNNCEQEQNDSKPRAKASESLTPAQAKADNRYLDASGEMKPEVLAALKMVALGTYASGLPDKGGCKGVKLVVIDMLQRLNVLSELHDRALKDTGKGSFDIHAKIAWIDRTAEAADRTAAAYSCGEWFEEKRKEPYLWEAAKR